MKRDRRLTREEEGYWQTVREYCQLFSDPEELRKALWPMIAAAIGSEPFAEMKPSERQDMMDTVDMILNFSSAAYQLLKPDIEG